MKWCLLGLMLLTAGLFGCHRSEGNPTEAATVAAIQKLGGKVELDPTLADHSVAKVYLHNTAVIDMDLASLKSLTQLKNLFLGKTQVTDAGLANLQGASQLQTLSLNATGITDAGLVHLAGLTNLKTLNLQETKVTAGGIAELKRKLPGLTIAK